MTCSLALMAVQAATTLPASAAEGDFRCGGDVEASTWALWDEFGRPFMHDQLLRDALRDKGDAYALYDFQTYSVNLAELAVRCGRTPRLQELSELIGAAYDELTMLPPNVGGGLGWLCRGGRVCNASNRLAGTEVKLTSTQFLALATRVAFELERQGAQDSKTREFIQRTVRVAAAHLERWHAGQDPMKIDKRRPAAAKAINNASSELFFSDIDLWTLVIHAQISGLLDARPALRAQLPDEAVIDRWREGVGGLLRLFVSRTMIAQVTLPGGQQAPAAQVDRGYWRLHRDSRYASYEKPEKPVVCEVDERGARKVRVVVPLDQVPVRDDIGWDFSHARRLVHAADALDRHRDAMTRIYSLPASALPPAGLARAYATQLLSAVWNGDKQRPLFANFWSGANGWYRVAYDSGSGGCSEGYPPFGLSDAFATGGFITWRRWYPLLGQLGERLYAVSRSSEPQDRRFTETYYAGLTLKASPASRKLNELMFWPTLVTGK